MGEPIQSKCGVAVTKSLHDAHSIIDHLKHRGPDMTGIAAVGDTIDVVRWRGPPSQFEVKDLEAILQGSNYHTYMAHCRYKTSGDDGLDNAHPQVVGGIQHDYGSHVVTEDCDAAMVHNGQVHPAFMQEVPEELLSTHCDTEQLLRFVLSQGHQKTLEKIPAAYTLAYARKGDPCVHVLRDRTGIRPGFIYKKDGKSGMASEDFAIAKNGGEKVNEIARGSHTVFLPNGTHQSKQLVPAQEAYCFFELAYLLHRLSHYVGREAHHTRRRFGKILADQMKADNLIPPHALVTYIPRCAEPMAQKFADETGLPFEQIFVKKKSNRSFLESTQDKRDESIAQNLYMTPEWQGKIKDQPIIIVDDSIVRGTNLKRPLKLLVQSGVNPKNITLASAVPPLGITDSTGVDRGCFWGVDMPPGKDFIARGRDMQEISQKAGLNVVYMTRPSLDLLFSDLGLMPERMCTYCVGGRGPYDVTINHTS